MSNYPPYQPQPYMPQPGPYMAPQAFQSRPDMMAPSSLPQPQTPPQQPQNPVMGLSNASRPVTSREEAMGVAADFSGARMLFPDIAHNRVYVKWWDFGRGEPVFQEYAPVVRPAPEQERPQDTEAAVWASLQDVQDLKDAMDKLQEEVNRLKRPTGKAAVKNDADAK